MTYTRVHYDIAMPRQTPMSHVQRVNECVFCGLSAYVVHEWLPMYCNESCPTCEWLPMYCMNECICTAPTQVHMYCTHTMSCWALELTHSLPPERKVHISAYICICMYMYIHVHVHIQLTHNSQTGALTCTCINSHTRALSSHTSSSPWAYPAENTSWYPTPQYSTFSVVHAFFENFDNKMVVKPSRLSLPLLSPCFSRTAGCRASALLELTLRSSLSNPLFWRDKNSRVVASPATVPRPFCCQISSKKACIPLNVGYLAWGTTMYFQQGTPTRTFICVCVCVCMYMYICMHNSHTGAVSCVTMLPWVGRIYLYACVCMYIHTHTHTHSRTESVECTWLLEVVASKHICTYIHIHTRTRVRWSRVSTSSISLSSRVSLSSVL